MSCHTDDTGFGVAEMLLFQDITCHSLYIFAYGKDLLSSQKEKHYDPYLKERRESSCIRDSKDYIVMMLVTILQFPVENKVIKKEEKLSQKDFFLNL